jgi:hypothetical protein
VDRYTISGIGYGLEGKVHHEAGASPSIDEAVLPFIIAATPNLRTANACPPDCTQLLASETTCRQGRVPGIREVRGDWFHRIRPDF